VSARGRGGAEWRCGDVELERSAGVCGGARGAARLRRRPVTATACGIHVRRTDKEFAIFSGHECEHPENAHRGFVQVKNCEMASLDLVSGSAPPR
jgi:hypothetical protein